MARPLRLEYHGALYHVTSRGDGQEDIYLDDEDREVSFSVLEEVVKRFNWTVHAYCLMSNHYHLLVETPDGNLAQGMRHYNGVYTNASIAAISASSVIGDAPRFQRRQRQPQIR